MIIFKTLQGLLKLAAELFMLYYLYRCSKSDIETRTITPAWALIVGGGAVLVRIIVGTFSFKDLLLVLLMFGVLFLISYVTHGALGEGDCYVVLACGLLYSFWYELSALIIALIICGCKALWKVIRGEAGRNDTFPFMPYLFTGHIALIGITFTLALTALFVGIGLSFTPLGSYIWS